MDLHFKNIIKPRNMKNLLLTLSIATMFVACKTETKEAVKADMVPINTAGYNMSNAATDVAQQMETEEIAEPVARRTVARKRTAAPVVREREYTPQQPQYPAPVVNNTPVPTPAPQPTTQETIPTASTIPGTVDGNGTTASTGVGTGTTEGTEATVPAKKKGWSNAAKGAVIGGAAGAIGGAIINGKNRGAGAIIGAVIGAGGGYVLGRKKDKNAQESSPYSMVVN